MGVTATTLIIFAPIIHKGIRFASCSPRVRTFAALKSAVLVEDTVIGMEFRGGGMGLNKHEKLEGESFRVEEAGLETPS